MSRRTTIVVLVVSILVLANAGEGAEFYRQLHLGIWQRANSTRLDHLIRIRWSHTERHRNLALILHAPAPADDEYHVLLLVGGGRPDPPPPPGIVVGNIRACVTRGVQSLIWRKFEESERWGV